MGARVEKGKFLVASPSLLDPNFRRTVVLLCEHGPQGSLGLVINRPTPVLVAKACPQIHGTEGRKDVLHTGGPVQPTHLLFLHRHASAFPGDVLVADGVRLGGQKEHLERLLALPEPPGGALFRCYLGYAGWGAGQLDYELSQNAWIVAPADQRLVFEADAPTVWSAAMRSLGGVHALFAELPDDPALN